MRDVHVSGIQYGPDFDHLDNLPGVMDGETVDVDLVKQEYDLDMMPFIRMHSTDARICLQAASPKPVTVLALVADMQVN